MWSLLGALIYVNESGFWDGRPFPNVICIFMLELGGIGCAYFLQYIDRSLLPLNVSRSTCWFQKFLVLRNFMLFHKGYIINYRTDIFTSKIRKWRHGKCSRLRHYLRRWFRWLKLSRHHRNAEKRCITAFVWTQWITNYRITLFDTLFHISFFSNYHQQFLLQP